jgi:hypothetical protein
MISKLLGLPARQIAGGLALCTVAIAAQADPLSLQGACHLTSLIAGQGQCLLEYTLSDAFTSGQASIKSGSIRIDNIIVHRYVNDVASPVQSSVYALNGGTAVSCGVSHVITAYIVRLGVGMPTEKVGSLPAVPCPVAP